MLEHIWSFRTIIFSSRTCFPCRPVTDPTACLNRLSVACDLRSVRISLRNPMWEFKESLFPCCGLLLCEKKNTFTKVKLFLCVCVSLNESPLGSSNLMSAACFAINVIFIRGSFIISAGELLLFSSTDCEMKLWRRRSSAEPSRNVENISRLQWEALQLGDKGKGNRNQGFIWVCVVELQQCRDLRASTVLCSFFIWWLISSRGLGRNILSV